LTTRVGIGYDVHAFAPAEAGRTLMLGGVEIPHDRGLAGHSDADVLLHAVVDALLGAAALGDIGQHFPSSDARWRDAPSTAFLTYARDLLAAQGWRLGNVDATIVAERPRLAPHMGAIRAHLTQQLGCAADQVSVKSKTTDGLGFAGRQEGIACYAVALIERAQG
jgi:2-C-methyl-D-erythritol 2,4-cyclodiphosphate synthase